MQNKDDNQTITPINESNMTQSTSQQMCISCKGTGKDRRGVRFAISLILGTIILIALVIAGKAVIAAVILIAWLYELYQFWTNECKICKGTGFVTITTTTVTK